MERVEERIERENTSAPRRRGPEKRTLWTESGPVTIMRQRCFRTDGREEKSFIGFDRRVDLKPRVHATPAFAEKLAQLARRVRTTGGPDLRQLDRCHVIDKVRSAYGWDRIEDAEKVMGLVFSEDRDGFERQTIFDRRRLPRRRSHDRQARRP